MRTTIYAARAHSTILSIFTTEEAARESFRISWKEIAPVTFHPSVAQGTEVRILGGGMVGWIEPIHLHHSPIAFTPTTNQPTTATNHHLEPPPPVPPFPLRHHPLPHIRRAVRRGPLLLPVSRLHLPSSPRSQRHAYPLPSPLPHHLGHHPDELA